jgi:magnesium chelatase family protein
LGVLVGSKQVPVGLDPGFVFLGELSLDGSVRAVHGVLPAVLAAVDAGFRRVIVPEANAGEAALVDRAEVYPVRDIGQVLRFLTDIEELALFEVDLDTLLKQPGTGHPDHRLRLPWRGGDSFRHRSTHRTVPGPSRF